jgi:23S rRNA U2552 (ribose-2'-O)-methylase RlmE/FtsJ
MKPLSRSFYKMVEICTQFNLCHSGNNNNSNDVINDIFTSSCGNVGNNHINQNNTFMHFVVPDSASLASQSASPKMTSFHLAEGPGGFIEAVCFMRKNPNDVYYGMTLVNSNSKCPGWKKSKTFLEENPNVIIEKGIDETGNLLSIENFKYCYEKYGGKIEFITGDGGVDFSENFNNQEHTATKLIIAQVIYAISMQSNGGNFVLKVFDIFSNATLDVLYLLSSLYKEVYIMKPNTSRYANSEKYIICKGFNANNNENYIQDIVHSFYENFDNLTSDLNIESFFKFKHDRAYFTRIEEINAIFGQNQIENILNTVNLIINKNTEKNEHLKKNNIQKCIQWCDKHGISHYKNIQTVNIFLPFG